MKNWLGTFSFIQSILDSSLEKANDVSISIKHNREHSQKLVGGHGRRGLLRKGGVPEKISSKKGLLKNVKFIPHCKINVLICRRLWGAVSRTFGLLKGGS